MTGARRLAAILLCALLLGLPGACGLARVADDAPLPDAPFVCDDELTLGLCRISETGATCRGLGGETAAFVSVEDGAPIDVVVGPQGAQMIVLAARTHGIAPGDPARPTDPGNPVLEVRLQNGTGDELATYRGRGAFNLDPLEPTSVVRPEIFVITERPLTGRLEATATVRDQDGVEHCGRLILTASP